MHALLFRGGVAGWGFQDRDQASRLRRLAALLGLLGLPVAHGRLDGVLCEHAAVQLDGGQAQVLGNVAVLNGEDVIHGLALDPAERRGSSGRLA